MNLADFFTQQITPRHSDDRVNDRVNDREGGRVLRSCRCRRWRCRLHSQAGIRTCQLICIFDPPLCKPITPRLSGDTGNITETTTSLAQKTDVTRRTIARDKNVLKEIGYWKRRYSTPKDTARRITHPDAEAALLAAKKACRSCSGRGYGRSTYKADGGTGHGVLGSGEIPTLTTT